MPGDWLKLYRRVTKSRVFASAELLRLWIWCLCEASWQQRWVTVSTGVGEIEVELQPGQFVFGRGVTAKKLRVAPSTLWKRMKKLETLGNVNIQSNTHCSVVSICNWTTYQLMDDDKEQAKEQQRDSNVTAREQQRDSQGTGKGTPKKEGIEEGEEGLEGKDGVEGEEQPTTSASDVKKGKRRTFSYPDAFDVFWQAIPKHKRKEKQETYKAWGVAGRTLREQFEEWDQAATITYLQERMEAYAASEVGQTKWAVDPKRWLAHGSYEDDPAAWTRSDNGNQDPRGNAAAVQEFIAGLEDE